MKLSTIQILGIILIIVGLVIFINPPVVVYDILLPDGKYTVKIGIRDFLLAYFKFETIEKFRLESISLYKDAQEKMQSIVNLTNTYLKTNIAFLSLYSKFRQKYQYIQICYEKLPRTYLCGTYILYPSVVVLSTYISSDYPTILLSKETFDTIYAFYSQGKFKDALDTLVVGYKKGKVIFINTNIIEFLSALS